MNHTYIVYRYTHTYVGVLNHICFCIILAWGPYGLSGVEWSIMSGVERSETHKAMNV